MESKCFRDLSVLRHVSESSPSTAQWQSLRGVSRAIQLFPGRRSGSDAGTLHSTGMQERNHRVISVKEEKAPDTMRHVFVVKLSASW